MDNFIETAEQVALLHLLVDQLQEQLRQVRAELDKKSSQLIREANSAGQLGATISTTSGGLQICAYPETAPTAADAVMLVH